MPTEQLSREQAIAAFNARNANIDINTDAGYAAFLDSIRELGSALGQEDLYNNFVEQLGNRQEFLREYSEDIATDAREIIQKANEFEVTLRNRNEEEHLTRRGRVQEQVFGSQISVEQIFPTAVAQGYGAIGWFLGLVQGGLHALGMDDLAERMQGTIDYLNGRAQRQTDRVRRIDDRTTRAEDPEGGYRPNIDSDVGDLVRDGDRVRNDHSLDQGRVAETEAESTDALRSTRDSGTSVSGADEERTITIGAAQRRAAEGAQNDNETADAAPVIRIRPTGTDGPELTNG